MCFLLCFGPLSSETLFVSGTIISTWGMAGSATINSGPSLSEVSNNSQSYESLIVTFSMSDSSNKSPITVLVEILKSK